MGDGHRKAGIKRGDVVVEYNGKKIQDVGHFGNMVALTIPDTKVYAKENNKEKPERLLIMAAEYPVLRRPSDAKLEFSMEVENKLDKDTVFNLFAEEPKDWNINFKPAYEDKYISNLRIKANGNETVAIQVQPSMHTQAGEYRTWAQYYRRGPRN